MNSVCRVCSAELPMKDVGRPAIFCSPACRRAAAYEVRRVEGRTGKLEARLSDMRCSEFVTLDANPTLLQAELAVQHKRLLELLADPEGEEAQ